MRTLLLAVFAALVFAAPAQADVLVNSPGHQLACGAGIEVGVWAQSFGKPTETVRIQARDARTGRVWWTRSLLAPYDKWRMWQLDSGQNDSCRPTIVEYTGQDWKARYRIRFTEGL